MIQSREFWTTGRMKKYTWNGISFNFNVSGGKSKLTQLVWSKKENKFDDIDTELIQKSKIFK